MTPPGQVWHIHDKHMKVQRRRTVRCLVGRQGSPSDVGEANWCLLSVSSCGDIIMGDSRRVNFRWACCSQQAVTGSHRRGNTRASWWKDDWRASLVSSLHVLQKHSSSKFPKHTKNSVFFNKMTQRLSVNPSCILIKLLTEPRLGSLSCFLSLVPLLSHISLALV